MQLVVIWKSCATFRSRKIGVFRLREVGLGALVSKRPGRDFPARARDEKQECTTLPSDHQLGGLLPDNSSSEVFYYEVGGMSFEAESFYGKIER